MKSFTFLLITTFTITTSAASPTMTVSTTATSSEAALLAQKENLCESHFDDEVILVIQMMNTKKDNQRWKKYGQFLKKYNHCLDGYYSETVQGLSEDALATDWPGFLNYVKKEKPSADIMRGLKMGFAPEMGIVSALKKIQANAKGNCPKTLKAFCKEIIDAKLDEL